MTLAVDTSAVLAILLDEPEMLAFVRAIRAAERAVISAASVVEIYRVAHARAVRRSLSAVDDLLETLALHVVPVSHDHLHFARDGLERFGKGRGASPAVLDFGDLFAYALARTLSAPLLFKGDDFAQTDVIPAWRPGPPPRRTLTRAHGAFGSPSSGTAESRALLIAALPQPHPRAPPAPPR